MNTADVECLELLTPDTLTNSFFGCPAIYGHNDNCSMQDKMQSNPGISIVFPDDFGHKKIDAYYGVYTYYGAFDPDTIGVGVGKIIYRLPTI